MSDNLDDIDCVDIYIYIKNHTIALTASHIMELKLTED